AHARRPRTVGVLLVRLGGYAAGVFTGYPPALADAKTGSRLVHGRSAAGGWSQHRFARRREKQASEALQAAAGAAADVFGRRSSRSSRGARDARGARPGEKLDAIVLGGDKRAMAELRQDPRLAPYLAIATDRFLTVPDPKRAVLEATPRLFLAVRIRLTEPTP
ncbi:MAG: acVLRF1 family peptidyl-tRNA hydrolase, partial [Trebonia sp.]